MIKKMINYFQDYKNRIEITTLFSALICLVYAVYNGVLGIINKSVWNCSIFFYYLFLLIFKLLLSLESKRKIYNNKRANFVIYLSFILLIFTTLSMITPAILLIKNEREYKYGLIPAIAMAAYTTYSVLMSIFNLIKSDKTDNIFIKQIRLINLISALMSIIVLQNTLIIVNGGMGESMTKLSIVTSLCIIIMIILLIIINFHRFIKYKKINNNIKSSI